MPNNDALPGADESYWMSSTDVTRFAPLTGDVTVDVAVIGGGISGLSAAWELAASGRSVTRSRERPRDGPFAPRGRPAADAGSSMRERAARARSRVSRSAPCAARATGPQPSLSERSESPASPP